MRTPLLILLALLLPGAALLLLQGRTLRRDLDLAGERLERSEGEVERLTAALDGRRREIRALQERLVGCGRERVAALEGELAVARKQEAHLLNQALEARRNLAVTRRALETLAAGRPGVQPPSPKPARSLDHQRRMATLADRLNRLLAASGHGRSRFFHIGDRTGKALLDVSFHHLDRRGIVGRAVRLSSLRLTLDPAKEELLLAAPKGRYLEGGGWHDCDPSGWQLRLKGVDPGPWENLGYGFLEVLPRPAPPPADPNAVPAALLADLKGRVNTLLKGERCLQRRRYRLASLGGIRERQLTDVELLGYTGKGRLVERFKVGRLGFAALAEGGVRLTLQKGTRFSNAGEQALAPAGYLILLPRADLARWRRLLPGRVE